jgi:hypothetical protein
MARQASAPPSASKYAMKVQGLVPPRVPQVKGPFRICNGCGGQFRRVKSHVHVSGNGRSIYCADCKKQ